MNNRRLSHSCFETDSQVGSNVIKSINFLWFLSTFMVIISNIKARFILIKTAETQLKHHNVTESTADHTRLWRVYLNRWVCSQRKWGQLKVRWRQDTLLWSVTKFTAEMDAACSKETNQQQVHTVPDVFSFQIRDHLYSADTKQNIHGILNTVMCFFSSNNTATYCNHFKNTHFKTNIWDDTFQAICLSNANYKILFDCITDSNPVEAFNVPIHLIHLGPIRSKDTWL